MSGAHSSWLKPVAASWTWLIPGAAVALLGGVIAAGVNPLFALLCAIALVGTVMAAVHHAEVVAHRVGEPFGTLILAICVTAIETSLILSMMLAGTDEVAVLPRDTIYAAVMIICNGVVGICILVGGLSHHEQSFRVEGAGAGLAALIALAVFVLVIPTFATASAPLGMFSTAQLVFVAISSIVLWTSFVFIQTVRHRDYFLPAHDPANPDEHAIPPTNRAAWISFALLLVSLVAVVGLAKMLSPTIESAVDTMGAPDVVKGIVIAILVLAPETWAAVRAAQANRLQTSMNLAIGSALASIGLTVPVVVVASLMFGFPLILGLESLEIALLGLTFLVSVATLGSGRTHVMQGAIHLVLFAAFLFFAVIG
jgi:Ca2+:H+ antiporter